MSTNGSNCLCGCQSAPTGEVKVTLTTLPVLPEPQYLLVEKEKLERLERLVGELIEVLRSQ